MKQRRAFACELCSCVTSKPSALLEHKRRHVPGEVLVQCTACDFKSWQRVVTRHVNSVHKYNGAVSASAAPTGVPSNNGIEVFYSSDSEGDQELGGELDDSTTSGSETFGTATDSEFDPTDFG